MEQISNYIIIATTSIMAILGVIEKSQNIKWKPLSKLFGFNKNDEFREEIRKDITDIKGRIDAITDETKENELDRIRFEILSFASSLKNGYIPDEVEFRHIHHIYDKYTSNGGNSYVHTKMDYIEEMERLINK